MLSSESMKVLITEITPQQSEHLFFDKVSNQNVEILEEVTVLRQQKQRRSMRRLRKHVSIQVTLK